MNYQESEDLNGELAPETAEAEDIELLKQALTEERERAETNLAGWQRTQADFINFKRRVEREKEEASKFANSVLMFNLLPALDDFERALASIPDDQAELSWAKGMRLIERKLQATLKAQGLSQIEALGKPFDPHFHEAVMQGKGEEGMVVEEVQKGYQLYDRVIRPTKVVVGSGKEEKKEG